MASAPTLRAPIVDARRSTGSERGDTCAAFLARAAASFTANGIDRIERVLTENHWSYKHSRAVANVIAELGARHVFIRPHCP